MMVGTDSARGGSSVMDQRALARVASTGLWALLLLLSAVGPASADPRAYPPPAALSLPQSADICRTDLLKTARASTWVRLEHRDRTYSKIVSELTIRVTGTWPLARDLLLGEDSDRYIRAMSCLTRREPGQQRHWREHRSGTPKVTSTADGSVRVVDRTYSWVDIHGDDIHVGIWRIRAGAELWTIRLSLPAALAGARWDEIMVDPGGRGAEAARPLPDSGRGATALIWRPAALKESTRKAPEGKARVPDSGGATTSGGTKASSPPSVTVSLRPSWQRSWAAQTHRNTVVSLDRAGTLAPTVVTAILLVYVCVLYRKRPAVPGPVRARTLRNLSVWAMALVVLNVLNVINGLLGQYDVAELTQHAEILFSSVVALMAAGVLLVVAGPPRRILVAAAALAVPPVVVAVGTDPFGLRIPSHGTYEASVTAQTALSIASACLMALIALGLTAAAWRLASDGGLLPPSRKFPGNNRILRLRVAGPIILVWTIVVAVFFGLVQERNWQRAVWLSDRTHPAFGMAHRNEFVWETMRALSHGQTWLLSSTWLLSAVAILSVLRTWHSPSAVSPFEDRVDRLLLLVFFAHVVTTFSGYYLGSSVLSVLWQPVLLLSLYWTVHPFIRRSVLDQPLERSGRPLADFLDSASRNRLLKKSRAYRETHAVLRRLDQGMFGDVPPKRGDLERKLRKLHNWPTPAGPDRLPSRMSVVDGALALGPRDDWWANGSRCAMLALAPSVPASLLMTWAWTVKGEAWQSTLLYPFGVPGILTNFTYWMATWLGAAFVMGVLWRHLPGRRGAAKAIPVTAAFTLLSAVDALMYQFTDEGAANLPLEVSAMLFVLTVTAIAMDFDTFRGERRYWQSRLGLLLSIYQMRYYSLQVAYLIAQVIAMIAIWEFFTEPDVVLNFDKLK
ncbi:DUF6185 family protein [Streptomyces sp. NPDC020875]|uniref:DUF6185 family protein n=1 Tax=Streptomyces sp. NPDC020875 TaxID=3154898 RepID=UPI0033C4AE5E